MSDDPLSDWEPAFERIRRTERGSMPTGSESARKAGGRKTWRSERASKRVARATSGIHRRRQRRFD